MQSSDWEIVPAGAAAVFGKEPFLTISSCESSVPINFLAIKCTRIGINFAAQCVAPRRDSDRPIWDAYGANTKMRAACRKIYLNRTHSHFCARTLRCRYIVVWGLVRSSAASSSKNTLPLPFSIDWIYICRWVLPARSAWELEIKLNQTSCQERKWSDLLLSGTAARQIRRRRFINLIVPIGEHAEVLQPNEMKMHLAAWMSYWWENKSSKRPVNCVRPFSPASWRKCLLLYIAQL